MSFAKILFILSILCFFTAGFLFWQRNNPKRIKFANIPTNSFSSKIKSSYPTRIVIPDLKIDLPVFPASVHGQVWDTTTKGASWLALSPIPGERGNSILYGHNWTNLLGNLIFAKPGQKIKIIYNDKSESSFLILSTAIVSPESVSVLNQTKDNRITVYTCTGLFDQKRFIVTAILQKAISKI